MKAKRISKKILFSLFCLSLLALAGCGQNNNGAPGDNTTAPENTGSRVAGAGQEKIYAYIREINPQARTITVDKVEVINGSNETRLNQVGGKTGLTPIGDWYIYNAGRTRQMYALDKNADFDLTGRTSYSRLGYDSAGLSMDTDTDAVQRGTVNNPSGTKNGAIHDPEDSLKENDSRETSPFGNTGSGVPAGDGNTNQAADEAGLPLSEETTPRYSEDGRLLNNGAANNGMTDNGMEETGLVDQDMLSGADGNDKALTGTESALDGLWADGDFQNAVNSINHHRNGDSDVLYLLTLERDKVVGVTRVMNGSL